MSIVLFMVAITVSSVFVMMSLGYTHTKTEKKIDERLSLSPKPLRRNLLSGFFTRKTNASSDNMKMLNQMGVGVALHNTFLAGIDAKTNGVLQSAKSSIVDGIRFEKGMDSIDNMNTLNRLGYGISKYQSTLADLSNMVNPVIESVQNTVGEFGANMKSYLGYNQAISEPSFMRENEATKVDDSIATYKQKMMQNWKS